MSTQIPGNSTIFREYIYGKEFPGNLKSGTEIFTITIDQFHLIVGFLTDTYDEDNKGTGNFLPGLTIDYLSHVKKLKRDYPNVKVIINIGGRGATHPFNPAKPEEWIDNAKRSVKEFIKKYNEPMTGCYDDIIDGIDINYEVVQSADPAVFAHCIGQLIGELVTVHNIKYVSIAPSKDVSLQYRELYFANKNIIHFVDYQFYDENISSDLEFYTVYESLLPVYGPDKLLPGYSTDPNDADGQLPLGDFIKCVKQLLDRKLTRGFFIWNAPVFLP